MLFKRYFHDGRIFIYLFVKHVIPHIFFLLKHRKYSLVKEVPTINVREDDSLIRVEINGICNNLNSDSIRNCFKDITLKKKDIMVDFSGTIYVDNSFLGLLLLLFKHQDINGKKLKVVNLNNTLKEIFKFNLLVDIFPLMHKTQED